MTPNDIAEARNAEWWSDAWWCVACDQPNYVGEPDLICLHCGKDNTP